MRTLSSVLIRVYQWVTWGWPPRCRFAPSCSEYTRQAIARYGAWKGWRLGLWRLLHCHPWDAGGYDPLP
ncbi:MAG: membrane protein insertion efficiency factor YidD [Elusimicrobia bacterium]|nr:membrane protein insertion efficiency factor YidD [Elusimicrobiota bacterium]